FHVTGVQTCALPIFRKLRPQAVREVVPGDRGADDLWVGPGEEEVPHQHRHHSGLPRSLAGLHGDALVGREGATDIELPVVGFSLKEVPNHLSRVFPPADEVLLGDGVDVAHSGSASGVTSMTSTYCCSGSFFRASCTLSTISSAKDLPLEVTSNRFTNIALLLARASAARRRISMSSVWSMMTDVQNSCSS